MNSYRSKVYFSHRQIDKTGRMIEISPKQPLEKRQKESSEKLSQVKATSGQNRVHAITIFPLEMIPF